MRYLAAVSRFKWLIAAIALAGTAGGFAVSRFLQPTYTVDTTILIAGSNPQGGVGPIQSADLLDRLAWPDLAESFFILDKVALSERLYITPARAADSLLFADFSIGTDIKAGTYRLEIDQSGTAYALKAVDGRLIERGRTGEPVGVGLGFQWTPPPAELKPGRVTDFAVRTPREAAIELRNSLVVQLPEGSNFMYMMLSGTDATRLAATMNALAAEFVAVAADLKKRSVVEVGGALARQLAYAEHELRDAEIALERFRVNTITLPSEGGTVASGVELTRDPVFASFFGQKVELDNVRRDREVVERMLAEVQRGGLDVSALLAAPAVRNAEALQAAIRDHALKETQLRAARLEFTDAHRTVRDLLRALDTLRIGTIPRETRTLIGQLERQEEDLESRIAAASRELRNIPTRSIEEMRLRRNVEVRENLYTMLKNRYEEARLAEVSSTPDIRVLDAAATPRMPGGSHASRIVLIAMIGSLGAGVSLAVLLDHLDSRFRYPEQATGELGLSIIGAVPTVPNHSRRRAAPDDGAQIIEAFRTIRLNLQHACGETSGTPVVVTVTSPGADDGKSLVCANLALSFAQAGYRTLLIDGDIRRGQLHSAFGVSRQPGLVDFLAGEAALGDVLRKSTHDRLALLTCGARRRSAPELLNSMALPGLVSLVRAQFDAIVVDSAPLAAGIDGYLLGTVTENMVIVLRAGKTNRRLAIAKLHLVQRLPIRVVGAVVNDFRSTGPYEYYCYLPGYTSDEPDTSSRPAKRA